MTGISLANILLAAGVFVWAVYRQYQTRPVGVFKAQMFLVLGAIGVWQIAQLADSRGISPVEAATLVVSLGLAALFGWLRGRAARIWVHNGVAYRRGGWTAMGLWAAAILTHVVVDFLGGVLAGTRGTSPLDQASIMLYLALTLGIQGLVIARRVAQLPSVAAPLREPAR